MHSKTAPQTKTAICCALGSAIRGTLSASEIVAKARIPSAGFTSAGCSLARQSGSCKHTHGSHNLRLKPILILESSGKVTEPAFAVRSSVRHVSDVVEHMPACEEKYRDQADRRPGIAVLDYWQDVWCRDCEE